MLPPPETYRFRFFCCVLQYFLLVFAFQKQPTFVHSFEDFGCLNMMSHDASCVDTMTYLDGICSVFDYRIILCSQQRVSIQTLTECARHCGQMSILSFTLVFTMCLFLFVTREILDSGHLQILQTYYLMNNMVDISWAFFSLLYSFSLVALLQWLNTLDDVWVLGGPRTS